MKITIFECYDPNSYDSDYEDEPYDIDGYRYIIDYSAHIIVGKTMFVTKSSCTQAMRRALKKYHIKLPDNFELTNRSYANAEFIV